MSAHAIRLTILGSCLAITLVANFAFAQISPQKKGELIRDLPVTVSNSMIVSGMSFDMLKIRMDDPLKDRQLCFQIAMVEKSVDTIHHTYLPLEANGVSTGLLSNNIKQIYFEIATMKSFCGVPASAGVGNERAESKLVLTTPQDVFARASNIQKLLVVLSGQLNIQIK